MVIKITHGKWRKVKGFHFEAIKIKFVFSFAND